MAKKTKKATSTKAETPAQPEPEAASPTPEPPTGRPDKEACRWAMFCHLAGLAWMLVWLVPVIGGVVGTLILWQIKKDDDPFIDRAGKWAFNFQLSMLIYLAVSALLCFACIGVVLVPTVIILNVAFTIIAAIRAADGKDYDYPLTIDFVK